MSRGRILFWVLLVNLATRLYGLRHPVYEYWHDWMQSFTAVVARNFYERDMNLFHPRIDFNGTEGDMSYPFPLYEWGVAVLYKIFGGENILLARTLSAILGSLSALFLVGIARRLSVPNAASVMAGLLWAALPLSLFFTRTVQPEATLLFFLLGGLYFWLRFLESARGVHLFISGAGIALAGLVKLYALHIGLPMLWLLWRKRGKDFLKDWRLWLFFVLACGLPFAWYHHMEVVGNISGMQTIVPLDWAAAFKEIRGWRFYERIYVSHLPELMTTHCGLALLAVAFYHRASLPPVWKAWAASLFIYPLILGQIKGGHDYYQLPFMPLVSILVALGAYHLFSSPVRWKRIAAGVLILGIPVQTYLRIGHWYKVDDEEDPGGLPRIAQNLQRVLPKDALIVMDEAKAAPKFFYLLHRRGWERPTSSQEESVRFIEEKRKSGAAFYIALEVDRVLKSPKILGYLKAHTLLLREPGVIVYGLSGP